MVLWVSPYSFSLYNEKLASTCYSCDAAEGVMSRHNFTKSWVATAAATVNAGVCLEDNSRKKTVFTNISKAIDAVSY